MSPNGKEKNVEIFVLSSESTQTLEIKPKSFFHIDKKMLRIKMHFLLFVGAIGTTLPFMSIFAMTRIGLSATSFGTMMTVQQFIFIVTKPLLGYIADYFNKLKVMIAGLIIVQSVFYFLTMAVPKIEKPSRFYDEIYSNYSILQTCLDINNQSSCFRGLDFNNVPAYFNYSTLENENSQFCKHQNSGYETSMKLYNEKIGSYSGVSAPSAHNLTTLNTCEKIVCENSTIFCNICCNDTLQCISVQCSQTSNDTVGVIDQVSDFRTSQYWLFSFILTSATICTNGLFTLSDAACCETISSSNSEFGRQRLFGAVGWGIMTAVGGYLTDYTHDFLSAWVVYAILSILSLWNLKNMTLIVPSMSPNILKDVSTVLRSPELCVFTLSVFTVGIGSGAIWFYLVWFLTKIGASTFLCGMAHFVQCFFGEMPFMFFSGWLIKKMGHFMILTLALLAFGIRFLWYSQLYNPWFVLPVEILHGVTYGVFYSSVASYAKLNAKPGTEATTQAILFTAHEGFGAGLGCLLFGVSFDVFGEHATFLAASFFAFAATVASFLLNIWLQNKKKNDSST